MDMKPSLSRNINCDRAKTSRLGLLPVLLALGLINPGVAAPAGGLDTAAVGRVQLVNTPATAEPEVELDPIASLRALSAYLTPDDINQLALYLRDVVVDILRGRQDATLPPDLAFKLALLEKRLLKEGDIYMQQALRNLDRNLKRFLQSLPLPIPGPDSPAAH